ncbi:MAG: response regulator [Candidatus Ozemobacteraceae bacterium]
MNLRRRSLFVIGVTILAAIIATGYGLAHFVIGGFHALEIRSIDQQLHRFLSYIDREKEFLLAVGKDWAFWDETWNYAVDRNGNFRKQNMQPELLGATQVDILIILDKKDEVLDALQIIDKGKKILPVASEAALLIASRVHFKGVSVPKEGLTDFIPTKNGLILAAAFPIMNSVGKGEPHGTLIMGRVFNRKKVLEISRKAAARFKLLSIPKHSFSTDISADASLPAQFEEREQLVRETMAREGNTVVREINEHEIVGYRILCDSRKRPVSILAVHESRSIIKTGWESLAIALRLFFASGLFVGFALLAGLERMILRPLQAIQAGVEEMAPDADKGGLLTVEGSGELSLLCSEINVMVSARRRTESALRQSEERLQLALQGTSDTLWDWNILTGEVFLSPQWALLLGFSPAPSEITFTRWKSFIHPEDVGNFNLSVQDHFAGHTPFLQVEFRVRNRQSEWLWLHARAKIVEKSPEGRPLRLSGLLSDIRERKRAEKEQQSIAEELAVARDQALAAVEAKTRFFANMSYEIRTSMNAVIGMTNLLLESDLETRQRENLETILFSGENLLLLINNILDLSQIESNALTLELMDFPLQALVEEAIEAYGQKAFGKGLELILVLCPELKTMVRGDPVRIRQVLGNLIDNAIKFTPRGEVVVDVRYERGISDRGVLRVEVRDTGIGLQLEDAHRLFFPEGPVDPFNKKREVEPGLGLTLSHRLVRMMGGEITVMSEPNIGSRFFFAIPLKTLDSGSIPQRWGSPLEAHGATIFIADDCAFSRQILHKILESLGASVQDADSGKALLKMVEKSCSNNHPPKLLFIDSDMPDMDGLETVRHLKQISGVSVPPIVLLVGDSKRGIAARARGLGISSLLPKPIKPDSLRELLRELLVSSGRNAVSDGVPALEKGTPLAKRATASKFRILIVEDKPINQAVARRILEGMGFRVEVAANGVEGLSLLVREAFDAVLMDCQMPEMDGYEATRQIRKREGTGKRLPIIAFTARALEGEREKCLLAGMDEYLTKPINPIVLSQTLWKLLDEKATGSGILPPVGTEDLKGIEERFKALAELLGKKEAGGIWWQFLQATPKGLHELQEALRAQDYLRLRKEAQNLRGSCSIIGALGMADICRSIEDQGSSDAHSSTESNIRALEGGFNLLLTTHANGKLRLGTEDR